MEMPPKEKKKKRQNGIANTHGKQTTQVVTESPNHDQIQEKNSRQATKREKKVYPVQNPPVYVHHKNIQNINTPDLQQHPGRTWSRREKIKEMGILLW